MRKAIAFSLLILSSFSSSSAQTFQDFLAHIDAVPIDQRQAVVDSFMNAVPAFPLVEQDSLAHFLYQGQANSVTVPGDANAWNISAFPMIPIEGTDFWYRSESFQSDARLDYKFVLNGTDWILDPRNPHTCMGGFGPNSELAMPAYVRPPEIEYHPDIPHGTLQDTSFFSVHMGNERTIRVYLPPAYSTSTDSFPMILFHDGLEYISLANADNVLDYLIHQESIEPAIAVFVPPINRHQEYVGGLQEEFTRFIVEELIPWVDSRFRTDPHPRRRAVMGASNGGDISLWLSVSHADIFANAAAQSSTIKGEIFDRFRNGPLLDLTLYLDLGTYDIPGIIPVVRGFIPILEDRVYAYRYAEYHEGHSWGLWRAHIDDALKLFFPSGAKAIQPTKSTDDEFQLNEN